MAPAINLAPRHIVAPGNARERLAARLHRRQNLQLLRFTPSPPPFPAQNLHRPSLALVQDVHNDALMDVTYPLTSILGRRPQSVGYVPWPCLPAPSVQHRSRVVCALSCPFPVASR